MLTFDRDGYLVPYNLIDSTIDEVQRTFTVNSHRRALFITYQAFLSDLQEVSGPCTQWIDGSFVTTKIFPGDVDVVTFLPFAVYEKNVAALQSLGTKYAGIDAYFVKVFPEPHPNYILYNSDRIEWLFQFSLTKPDRSTRKKQPKGFIQMKIV